MKKTAYLVDEQEDSPHRALKALLAKRALATARVNDFSNWAENLLSQGCDSENVAILAGFCDCNAGLYEVEAYFKKCVDELGLVLVENRAAIFEYAKNLAFDIDTGILDPRDGLEQLKDFWLVTDNDEPLYRIWDELAEDVCAVESGDAYLWNTGLSKENVDEFVAKVAKQFLQLSEINLPEHFFALCVCSQCGHIGKPQLKRLDLPWLPEKLFRLIYGKAPVFKWVCGSCVKPDIKNMFDYEGREYYLNAQHPL